jgi:hypothetical protein
MDGGPVLCISTIEQVLHTLFAGQHYRYQVFETKHADVLLNKKTHFFKLLFLNLVGEVL